MEQAEGRITAREVGAGSILSAEGRWVLETAARLDREIAGMSVPADPVASLDVGGIVALDTAGAILLRRLARRFGRDGEPLPITGGKPAHAALIDAVPEPASLALAAWPRPHPVIEVVARIGRTCVLALKEARDLLNFLGMVALAGFGTLMSPRRLRVRALLVQVEKVGLDALPIVGLLSFLIGVVLAYQGADQLARFGAQLFVVNLLGISVLREIGVLMTSIIVAGRSGSAFTAQIGTMKVNQEVDALHTLGLDPIEMLVLPRMLALMVVLPLLTFYADVMALLGGAVMARFSLDVPFGLFMRQLRDAVDLVQLLAGLVKAPVFAFVIALVGCYEGLKVSGSAESVGRLTTQSVVVSIFLVIVLDAIFSIFFSLIGI
ncbi:MAG TPA: ABC transporter permease [Arenibaculum sp.]|nr:ABC transporter permease [Arenibaculum sp.]